MIRSTSTREFPQEGTMIDTPRLNFVRENSYSLGLGRDHG